MPNTTIPVHNTPLYFSHPLLDNGKAFVIQNGADSIQWEFGLNVNKIPTYGGEVDQILSVFIGPITISGPTANNPELRDIYTWFLRYMQQAGLFNRNEQGITFQYPERGWSFIIQVTNLTGFTYDRDKIATPWSVTAEIVQDDGRNTLSSVTMDGFTSAAFDPSMWNVGFNPADARVNPLAPININPEAAANIGDNFDSLLGAWASGDYAHWGFDSTNSTTANKLKDSKSYWTSIFGTDFLVKSPTQGGGSALLGAGGVVSGTATSSALSSPQNEFARQLSARSGLSFTVVVAWVHAENQADGYNYLSLAYIGNSLHGIPVIGRSPGGWSEFSNVNNAANATYLTLQQSDFQYILNTAGKSDQTQINAIAYVGQSSPNAKWGTSITDLQGSYNAVKGTISGLDSNNKYGASAVATAQTQLGVQETPPGSNITKYGAEYGDNGAFWCAQFETWCLKRAGSKFHYESVPAIWTDAQAGRNGLSVTHNPTTGTLVIYNLQEEPLGDHTNFFESWIQQGKTFKAIGGNQGGPYSNLVDQVSEGNWDMSNVVGFVDVSE